ncbi:uncharacterized protein LOC119967714 [Scyliorhinus canicula]|uniref:uncharacterized protein LOC119967714 n=1 Tax=Scyliorhinus canicula TaxID=7830 RepID=UPI0018F521FA|nr:uncharacterized protein LOC119967714 [Scyliorhinus canicula]
MGNSLGCVRQQQETAEADQKKSPLRPQKKTRFKRVKKNKKVASHSRDAARRDEKNLTEKSFQLLQKNGETGLNEPHFPLDNTVEILLMKTDADPKVQNEGRDFSDVLQEPVHLSNPSNFITKTVFTPDKSIDVNVEDSGESAQQAFSFKIDVKPIDEHVEKFGKEIPLPDQISSRKELCDRGVKPSEAEVKEDLRPLPFTVSGTENETLRTKGNAAVSSGRIENITDAAAFDCIKIKGGVEIPTSSRMAAEERLQLEWEGKNSTRFDPLDEVFRPLHTEHIYGESSQSSVHRETEALKEEVKLRTKTDLSPLQSDFTLNTEPQTNNILHSSGYCSNLLSTDSEFGRTSRDFELLCCLPDRSNLSVSENEFELSMNSEGEDNLEAITLLDQEMVRLTLLSKQDYFERSIVIITSVQMFLL